MQRVEGRQRELCIRVGGFVGQEFAGGAAPAPEVLGDALQLHADAVDVVVEHRIVDHFDPRALAAPD